MPTIVVEVMPKAELLDPAGKAVAGALRREGGSPFRDVIDAPPSPHGATAVRLGHAHDRQSSGAVGAEPDA